MTFKLRPCLLALASVILLLPPRAASAARPGPVDAGGSDRFGVTVFAYDPAVGGVVYAAAGDGILVTRLGRQEKPVVWKLPPAPAGGRRVRCLTLSANGAVLMAGDDAGHATVFTAGRGRLAGSSHQLAHPDVITACELSPDGKRGLVVTHRGVHLIQTGVAGRTLTIPDERPDARGAWLGVRDEVVVWAASGFMIWDTSGKLLASVPMSGLASLGVSQSGDVLAYADGSGEVHVWNVAGRRPGVKFRPACSPVTAVAFVPGTRTVLVSGTLPPRPSGDRLVGGTFEAWDYTAGRKLDEVRAHRPAQIDADLLPNFPDGPVALHVPRHGHFFATTGSDADTCVWESRTGKRVAVIQNARLLSWSGDGHHFLGTRDGETRVFDVGRSFDTEVPPAPLWDTMAGTPTACFGGIEQSLRDPDAVRRVSDALMEGPPPPEWLDRRVSELAAPLFATREQATADLRRYAGTYRDRYLELAAANPSPEVAKRLRAATSSRYDLSPEELRICRAIYFLERAGGETACGTLKKLLTYPAGSPVNMAAESSLLRAKLSP